jgi:hypothetical protein
MTPRRVGMRCRLAAGTGWPRAAVHRVPRRVGGEPRPGFRRDQREVGGRQDAPRGLGGGRRGATSMMCDVTHITSITIN